MHFEMLPVIGFVAVFLGGVLYVLMPRATQRLGRMSTADSAALRRAVARLERPSFTARLASMVGKPIEMIGRALPPEATDTIAAATSKSLEAAFKVALLTLHGERHGSSHVLHKALAVASGAAGGAFGIMSLPFELPVSTIIMLRSILDIARSEGEDLRDPEAVLSCIAVLGLGGDTENGGYYAQREKLSASAAEAALYIAERGAVEEASPVLAPLLALIATRFGAVVSEKAAAQTVPIIGALGGAAINYAFVGHFQAVARGHFTVRRLERIYGRAAIHRAYQRARDEIAWN